MATLEELTRLAGTQGRLIADVEDAVKLVKEEAARALEERAQLQASLPRNAKTGHFGREGHPHKTVALEGSHTRAHALLPGTADHSDTDARTVVRGDLITGNATPRWVRKGIGSALEVLRVNAAGTDVEYSPPVHGALGGVTSDQHHAQSHAAATHSDQGATGAELEALTDGSETALHSHAGGAHDADQIIDADADTLIQVDESGDDDTIRFDIAGTEEGNWDTNRFLINNVLALDLTNGGGIVSGVVSPTSSFLVLSSETDTTDDLIAIDDADVNEQGASVRLSANSGHTITVKDDDSGHGDVSERIHTTDNKDFVLIAALGSFLDVVYVGGASGWREVCRASAASPTAGGVVELATTAETNTGTDATRAVTPDALKDSRYGLHGIEDPLRLTYLNPTSSDDFTIGYIEAAFTISKMRAVLANGSSTPSVTYKVFHDPDRGAAGNAVVTAGNTVTSVTTGDEETSFNDATIPAGSWVWLETTAKSGTVPAFHLTILGTYD